MADRSLGSATPTPGPAFSAPVAAKQAAVLDRILGEAAKGRALVLSALVDAGSCHGTTGARKDLHTAVKLRQDAVNRTERTRIDALPHHPQLQAGLLDLLRISIKADQGHLAWAGSAAPCRDAGGNAEYRRANTYSERATALKKDFLSLWNPITKTCGPRERGEDGI